MPITKKIKNKKCLCEQIDYTNNLYIFIRDYIPFELNKDYTFIELQEHKIDENLLNVLMSTGIIQIKK